MEAALDKVNDNQDRDSRVEHAFAEVRAMGAQFDPEILHATRLLFAPVVSDQSWMRRPVHRDLRYGDDPRHLLDFYLADRPGAPLLVFVPGGGFVSGDKRVSPPFNANVGCYFAEHGYSTIVMNYRLAPEHQWPAGGIDVAAVMHWIAQHAADYAADPETIFLLGQSAGAAHAMTYLFDPVINSPLRRSVKGAALLSGTYWINASAGQGARAYFGQDEALWSERSPAQHIPVGHIPLLLSVAELDSAPTAQKTYDLVQWMNRLDRRPPRLTWFEGCNHVSTLFGLGLAQDCVGIALRRFFSGSGSIAATGDGCRDSAGSG